jgi:hypothetical protein
MYNKIYMVINKKFYCFTSNKSGGSLHIFMQDICLDNIIFILSYFIIKSIGLLTDSNDSLKKIFIYYNKNVLIIFYV